MRTAANVFSFFFLLLWLAIPGLGQSPQVDIEVNQTHGLNDDYLTWAPTKCRAKITGAGDTTGATMIELHSHSLPVAADQPAGAVLFALEQGPWPVDTTASQATIQLNLPHDGSWVPFIVAGKFGHPSTNDKDCSIEANVVGSSDVVGHCKVMVRVRKNGNDLHAVEKSRYVAAMRGFRDRLMNGYLSIEEMHRLAAAGGHHDEAHSQPGFFPWHRAFVLQVERELQKIDPAVALHYWNWDAEAPNIFAADFIGGSGTSGFLSPPVFTLGHPFDDWNTELPFANGAIIRNTQDHTVNPANDPAYPFVPLDDGDADDPSDFSCLVEFDDYGPFDDLNGATSFSWYAERRAHDLAHGWPCGGGHLTNPNRSACDPLFFLLHSQVDRQWAYWQSKKFRSGVVVGGALKFPAPQHYDNEGKFDDMGNAAWYKGSFEEDYMWPWDGSTGPVAGNVRASRPVNQAPAGGANVPTSRPIIPQTPFAASTIRNLWPATATAVRVRDTIDYLGKFRPSDGLGYCYDDVPY